MSLVKVKEKYQVTLPASVRQKAGLVVGDLPKPECYKFVSNQGGQVVRIDYRKGSSVRGRDYSDSLWGPTRGECI